MSYQIIRLTDKPEMKKQAAQWFHQKWNIPLNAYTERIDTLYLLTDHTSFYERYGWEFLCMVQGNDEPEMSRMYRHKG